MVGASHSTNTDDIPGTCKQTISQNKLGYAAVTPPPPTPIISLTLTFPMQVTWDCLAMFTETQAGWGRLYLGTSMVVRIGLPRLYFQNCQGTRICPLDLKSF